MNMKHAPTAVCSGVSFHLGNDRWSCTCGKMISWTPSSPASASSVMDLARRQNKVWGKYKGKKTENDLNCLYSELYDEMLK